MKKPPNKNALGLQGRRKVDGHVVQGGWQLGLGAGGREGKVKVRYGLGLTSSRYENVGSRVMVTVTVAPTKAQEVVETLVAEIL